LPNYIADRYAATLTTEDTAYLFNALTNKLHGNRSEAARQCDLTGKTTYDWGIASYVKINTRRKVLEACLKIDFLDTVEYLLKRSNERAIDILRTVLSTIYAEAVETASPEQYAILLDRFERLTSEYHGLVYDKIKDEVTDMLWTLRQKAQELKVPVRPKSIDEISAKELLQALPLLAEIYLSRPKEAPMIAETFEFPPDSIKMLWPIFEKLRPTEEIVTEDAVGITFAFVPSEKMWHVCEPAAPVIAMIHFADETRESWPRPRTLGTRKLPTSSQIYELFGQPQRAIPTLQKTDIYTPRCDE